MKSYKEERVFERFERKEGKFLVFTTRRWFKDESGKTFYIYFENIHIDFCEKCSGFDQPIRIVGIVDDQGQIFDFMRMCNSCSDKDTVHYKEIAIFFDNKEEARDEL